jgi:hemin uptake protein HemP
MARMSHAPPIPPAPFPAPAASPTPRWSSETLLAGQRETHIAHHGTVYTLRLTASGKLILTK